MYMGPCSFKASWGLQALFFRGHWDNTVTPAPPSFHPSLSQTSLVLEGPGQWLHRLVPTVVRDLEHSAQNTPLPA